MLTQATIAVLAGADLVHRRPRLKPLEACVHELRPVERGEIADDDRPCDIGSFHDQQERRQRTDIGCVDCELECVGPALPNMSIQNTRVCRLERAVG